ncbi:hypothetical protein AA313_de0209433 [Arthrobotrys entomopaga]|nr:hypothetical protein AA313_de0209433 [Arthrobotrys entomopaga]
MKPVISAGNAWSCTVVSFFAVIILTVIGLLFKAEHEVVAGKLSDPDKPQVAAATIFGAVAVYGDTGIDTDDGYYHGFASYYRSDGNASSSSATIGRSRSRRRRERSDSGGGGFELWSLRRDRRRAKQD